MTPKQLQVAVGDSAAGCLMAGLPCVRSDVVVDRDQLSCGPLGRLVSVEAWQQLRDAYWNEVSAVPRDVSVRDTPASRLTPSLVARPEILLTTETVYVWLGVSLSNQLFLAWLLELAPLIGLDPQRIRVVQFQRHPVTGEAVNEVGELATELVATHPPAAPLTSAAIDDLHAAWAAIAAPEPTLLVRYLEAHPDSPAPFHRAFARMLGRFPDRDSGLNRWELELLRGVPEAGITTRALLGALCKTGRGELDDVRVMYLEDRLRRLSDPTLRHPLLVCSGDADVGRRSNLALTATGRSVLRGEANSIDLNGIDDWIGGMHLQSTADRVWVHSRSSLVVRES